MVSNILHSGPLRSVVSLVISGLLLSTGLKANKAYGAGNGWGISAAYNNPLATDLGINVTYFGEAWAGEFGVGHVGSSNSGLYLAGDINGQYYFLHDMLRPYGKLGLQFLLVGNKNGAGVDTGGLFLGGGLQCVLGSRVYLYVDVDYLFPATAFYPGIGLGLLL